MLASCALLETGEKHFIPRIFYHSIPQQKEKRRHVQALEAAVPGSAVLFYDNQQIDGPDAPESGNRFKVAGIQPRATLRRSREGHKKGRCAGAAEPKPFAQ